jgi:threonine dehydrogenase-like Zn-dependent dehydrogenase
MKKAAVLPGVGQPLEVREFPEVRPERGAVVVDVRHGGICGTDVHLQDGRLPTPTPLVLGHEAVGVVSALGEGITADALGEPLREGDLVTWASSIPCMRCFFCLREKEYSLCVNRRIYGINQGASEWPHLSGGWSEQIYLQPGSTVLRIPHGVTAEQVIALGCAGPTVVHGLLGVLPPRVGDVVVVQGSGPVGLAAAMYARLAGASRIIMVGGPRNRLAFALEMGVCDVAVDIFEVQDAGQRLEAVLSETSAGLGADLVVEATGVPTAVAEGIDMCRRNGRYLVLGQYTDHGPTAVNPHLVTKKQLTVAGSWAFAGEHYITYLATLPRLAERFDVARLVTQYPLEEVNRALADMRSGETLKPVLTPSAT